MIQRLLSCKRNATMRKYTKYKNSGILWIGQIPEHWEVCKVKHLFGIARGRVIPQTELIENGKYPVYSSQTENNGCMGFLNTFDYDGDCLTWTTDGVYAGTVFLRRGKFNCTNVCGILTLTSQNVLGFLLYAIQFAANKNKRQDTNGAKIMSNEMAEIQFPLPPLSEQQAIAKYLDEQTEKIDKSMESLEQQKADLQKYRTSVISETVTRGLNPSAKLKDSGIPWIGQIPERWEVKKIKHIASFINGYAFDSQMFGHGNTMVIRIGDIQDKLSYDTCTMVNEAFEYTSFLIQKSDVLVAMSGATTGKSCIVQELQKAYINQRVGIIRSQSSNFISFVLQTPMWKYYVDFRNAGSAQPNISSEAIMNYRFPLPPFPEQQAIADFLDAKTAQIDAAIATIDTQIADLRAYRTSIITEAVTGKFDVR